jgi:hypothetical protein
VLAAHEPARTALELAAWIGHAPSRDALGARAHAEPALVECLVGLCDWDVEALARAALAIGGLALDAAAPDVRLETEPRLRAARALVDCPCHDHALGLLSAANEGPKRNGDPGCDAIDQACLLAFRAHEARFTAELEALAGLLVGSASAAGFDVDTLREAVRREVVPWVLGRARAALQLEDDDRAT